MRSVKMKLLLILLVCFFSATAGEIHFSDAKQEHGYIQVRDRAHMFWWLYYTSATDVSDDQYHHKPLVIWLQGGPGESSSGVGNFMELGPLTYNLERRNYSWVNDYNVLFIDSPVGTGFSYVEDDSQYCKTNAEIAADLLKFVTQFYKLFPQFVETPVYIASESYGGKMSVEFANNWYKAQTNGSIKSELKGIALGSPWISPADSVLEYAPTLFYMGVIDRNGFEKINNLSLKTVKAMKEEKWIEASKLLTLVEESIFDETDNMDVFNVLTKLKSNSELLENKYNSIYDDYMKYINRLDYFMNTIVKNELNLNIFWGHTSGVVNRKLEEDFMKPVVAEVETLLNETNLKVYIFNGQLDPAVNTMGTLKWIEKLRWNHAKNWNLAKRKSLVVNGVIEGYVKSYCKLKLFWINRAGHMTTVDNPHAVNAVLKDLINDL